jgi:methyl-accepting chemotaxis protein
MFNRIKLTPKIGIFIAAALSMSSVLGFFITERRLHRQAEESFVDKLRKTDAMASHLRSFLSANVDTYTPHHEFKDLKQVPVVAAWSVAREYAESQGMKFSTPSLQPRNPANNPDEFEAKALLAFESDSGLQEYYSRTALNGAEVMRFAVPVRLTADCLNCHAGPKGDQPTSDYAKEGMKAGDLRGAFVVTAPLTVLNEASSENNLALLATDLGVLCSGVVVVFFVVRRIVVKPVVASAKLAEEIAANNLAVADIEVTSADELGQAGVALNRMKNNLREMIRAIAGTAEHVASASEEISASANQQSQSAETQKDQAIQVATAMQEMSSTVLQVSENSNRAAEASRKAAETARHGGNIVQDTLGKMRVIAESVGGTARKMEELGKRSDEIGRIIAVIDDIADQTNLLALNAAIEAARAGEQGRGFAVVADEVRKLAERTTTATKEIALMIKNIQDETKAAVTAMEAGSHQVEEGVKSTAQAGESLKEIIQMAEEVGEMITHIATAATEQSAASEEVNQNMDQIAKLVKESATGAQQSAKACQDLSGLALDLQKMVGDFKLDGKNGHSQGGSRQSRHEDQSGKASGGASAGKALAASAG